MKRHGETRERAKQLRTCQTESERRLWNALRANRLGVKFQRQVVLAPFVADFAARSERLIVEVDGDTHGLTQVEDVSRSQALARRGYRVIRFSNEEVMHNLDGVLRSILIELGRDPDAPLSPTLSP